MPVPFPRTQVSDDPRYWSWLRALSHVTLKYTVVDYTVAYMICPNQTVAGACGGGGGRPAHCPHWAL